MTGGEADHGPAPLEVRPMDPERNPPAGSLQPQNCLMFAFAKIAPTMPLRRTHRVVRSDE
jgi:hypothetical protein